MRRVGLPARDALCLGLAVLLLGAGCSPGIVSVTGTRAGPSASDCSDPNASGCNNSDGNGDSDGDDTGTGNDDGDSQSPGQASCEPGARQCSSDSSDIVQCDENGTAWVKTSTCTARQACALGACVDGTKVRGRVMMLGPADNMQAVPLAPGKYGLAVVNNVIATNARELSFPVQISGAILASNAATGQAVLHPLPTVLHPSPPWRLHSSAGALTARSSSTQPRIYHYQVGDRRVFNYYDSSDGYKAVHKRTGALRHSGTNINIWEDITSTATGSVISDSDLVELARRVDTGIVPRDMAIFGAPTDVDGNGKVDILLCNMLADKGGLTFPGTLYPQGYYSDLDFGEVIYIQGPNQSAPVAWIASLLAHELTHLIYYGVQLKPYLNPPREAPLWYEGGVYLWEGLCNLAMLLSGQYPATEVDWALTYPELWTLGHLFDTQYATDHTRNCVMYGEGTLMLDYLVEQAGGVEITSPASVTDRGARSFLKQFIGGRPGVERLVLPDGRGIRQTYVGMAAAVLRGSLTEQLPPLSSNQPVRYAFQPVRTDPVFGDVIGVPYRHEAYHSAGETGPALKRTDWSQRASTLLEGGVAFHDLIVGPSGATLTNTDANTHVVLLRYSDLK